MPPQLLWTEMVNSSLHVPSLPLVFVLSLSPPPPASPSYLHLAYSRSTLALLRVQNVVVPAGMSALEMIVKRVCRNPIDDVLQLTR